MTPAASSHCNCCTWYKLFGRSAGCLAALVECMLPCNVGCSCRVWLPTSVQLFCQAFGHFLGFFRLPICALQRVGLMLLGEYRLRDVDICPYRDTLRRHSSEGCLSVPQQAERECSFNGTWEMIHPGLWESRTAA